MQEGVRHGITVVCHHPLSCCIYTVLVSLIFGTSIPTSLSILMFILDSLVFIACSNLSKCPYIVDAGAVHMRMNKSHDKYAINEEMASDYTEVPVYPCHSRARGVL